jgi:hypothetical protein
MREMPRVQECTITGCGYNHDGCTAFAIIIGRVNSECDTYVQPALQGGIGQLVARTLRGPHRQW